MKKTLALVLALVMVLSLAACGSTAAPSTETPAEAPAETPAEAPAEAEVPATVSEPITITIWHTMSSGSKGDRMTASIQEFNETNPYGITVQEVYQGSYDELQAKLMQAVSAGTQPEIAMPSCNAAPVLAANDCLADLSAYVARDNFDMDNLIEGLAQYVVYNGEIITFPYVRSTAIFYYNKGLFDAAPSSLEELVETSKKIYADSNGEIKGMGFSIEANYYQQALLASLNGTGILNADGTAAGGLDDGSVLQFLNDWHTWTEEGYCAIPALSNADSALKEDFINGKLASYISSAGTATGLMKSCEENGIDLGIGYMPGYGGYTAPIGGGSLGVIEKGNTQQEIAAAWEFIKFILSDEQVGLTHRDTGYVPVTKSAAESEFVQNLWAENPAFKTAFEQLDYAREIPFSVYTSEWTATMKQAFSEVIQGRDVTPEKEVEKLQAEAEVLFN